MVEVSIDAVRQLGMAAMQKVGADEDDAGFLVDSALDKAVQGDHTRGLESLQATVHSARRGEIDLHPSVTIMRESPGTALVGAGAKAARALVCRAGMDLAIAKARQTGIAWVSVRVAAGSLTPYVRRAVDAGMVGMVLTETYPLVAPHGGYVPLLGNAPIAFGIPAGEHDPVILDMSLTQSSASGVVLAAAQGQPAPPGCVLDEEGNPTTDASVFPRPTNDPSSFLGPGQGARGSLAPLGGSHKAYALIFVVSLLTTILTDADAPWAGGEIARGQPVDPTRHYGSTFMALDPSAFGPLDTLRQQTDAFIDAVKASPTRPGVEEILYPGELSQRIRRQRRDAGSFLIPAHQYQNLLQMARTLDLETTLAPLL
jgi:LDH2 family malate/lactate/ureidoglycolate dehydrogenase